MSDNDSLNRYGHTHEHGGVIFVLDDFVPDLEECRFLMLKLIEQAVQDYLTLYKTEFKQEQLVWATAAAFIYDDTYRFMWGDWEISPEQFMDIVDIEIDYLRESVTKRFKNRYGVENG